ncbi:hypothetical protein, partial [Microtetraspora malaysiensis]
MAIAIYLPLTGPLPGARFAACGFGPPRAETGKTSQDTSVSSGTYLGMIGPGCHLVIERPAL